MSNHSPVLNSPPLTLISGGQTGADRAALDFALATGLPHDGWCPRGRLAEDGPLAARYLLRETPSTNYLQRTEWNVRDSDATLVFSANARPTGGTRRTVRFAAAHWKPCLVLHLDLPVAAAADLLSAWIRKNRIGRLNVAGSRASKAPTIGDYTTRVLSLAFDELNSTSATTLATTIAPLPTKQIETT